MADYTCKIEKAMDYKDAKTILNGECECSSDEYDQAVATASKCIDLLVDIAKMVNDPGSMSSFVKEKIRHKVNQELKNSKEDYIHESEW